MPFALQPGRHDDGVPRVPRRRLTPLARGVLWELEEAGSDEAQTLRVTLQSSDEDLDAVINDLARQGLVYIDGKLTEPRCEVVLTDPGRRALTE